MTETPQQPVPAPNLAPSDPMKIAHEANTLAAQAASDEAEKVRQRMLGSWGALHRVCKQISMIDTAGLRDAYEHLNSAHPGWKDWPGAA